MYRQSGNRVFIRSAMLVGLLAVAAGAQQVTTTVQTTLPSSRGGLIGQPAVLPNVLGRNRSLPIERLITLPGLPAGTPTAHLPGSFPVPAIVGRNIFHDGDGLRIDGRYDDDNLALRFHLGTGYALHERGLHDYPSTSSGRGYYLRDGRIYYDPSWYYYRSGVSLSTGPIDGVLTSRTDATLRSPRTPQPAVVVEPEVELTVIERARLLMGAEELDEAIESFRDHLDEDPEDVQAMRDLGVAMIEAGRAEDGIAAIAMAYRTDPLLARSALDLAGLGLEGRRYDNLLSHVLLLARKIDSGSAHLAGAMLLQADGKVAGAARVLDRAERAGLADEVVGPLRRELGIPAHKP